MPLVLSDYIVEGNRQCLKNAPGRQQDPENNPSKMEPDSSNVIINTVADGSCTTRPSCCPGANASVTDEQCDTLCTTGMDPLEHTTATLGPGLWKEIIAQCAESNPNDKAFCKFAGKWRRRAARAGLMRWHGRRQPDPTHLPPPLNARSAPTGRPF